MQSVRLRQIALVAHNLAPAVEEACAALDAAPVFSDPALIQFGLENCLLRLGHDTFVELVAPVRDNTTAGRYLDKFGPGGYMILLQVRQNRVGHMSRLAAAPLLSF